MAAIVAAGCGGGMLAAAGGAGAAVLTARAAAARAAGSWGRAARVPGLAALNKGGDAGIDSLSCTTPGNCAAAGRYLNRDGRDRVFVASERHGRWGRAIALPGVQALSRHGEVHLLSLSCGGAGNCAVGGYYFTSDHPDLQHAFVASERHGRWGKAIQVPGLLAPSRGTINSEVDSVSCGAAGNCVAGGSYVGHAFVAAERHGRWGKAIAVPGLALSDRPVSAEINQVSCASAGNCAVGGDYTLRSGLVQGYVAAERHGRWGKAITVPGLAALNTDKDAVVWSVSCASAGNCTAGGTYLSNQAQQGFVVTERNGRWGKAIALPGLAALNTGGEGQVAAVSCASAGNCAASGFYLGSRAQGYQIFVASERNGAWGTAIEVPGLAVLNPGRGDIQIPALSCASAASCAVGGLYTDRSHRDQGFVAVERNGRWGNATQVPGLAALNTGGDAVVASLSCPSPGGCTAGGSYADRARNAQGFVVTQTR